MQRLRNIALAIQWYFSDALTETIVSKKGHLNSVRDFAWEKLCHSCGRQGNVSACVHTRDMARSLSVQTRLFHTHPNKTLASVSPSNKRKALRICTSLAHDCITWITILMLFIRKLIPNNITYQVNLYFVLSTHADKH